MEWARGTDLPSPPLVVGAPAVGGMQVQHALCLKGVTPVLHSLKTLTFVALLTHRAMT